MLKEVSEHHDLEFKFFMAMQKEVINVEVVK